MSGFNVNTIAIEMPIAMLTRDGALHAATDPVAAIGTYATTSRPRIKTQPTTPGGMPGAVDQLVQMQRMGNPLINELLIGTGDKDKFSMSEPKNDAQFARTCSIRCWPRHQRRLRRRGGDPDAAAPRPAAAGDLRAADRRGRHPARSGADLLRLNTGVPPTPPASRKRLGLLAGDPAGYPNGRRVSDDVTDIAARVVVGVLAGRRSTLPEQPHRRRRQYQRQAVPGDFPLRRVRADGRNSRHVDPRSRAAPTPSSHSPPANCPPYSVTLRSAAGWLLALLAGAGWVGAAPFVPADRRPRSSSGRPSRRPIRRCGRCAGKRAALARAPGNLALALQVARRYSELGRVTGDPRYSGYAQAALLPWWDQAEPPRDVLLLRATPCASACMSSTRPCPTSKHCSRSIRAMARRG